VKEKGKLKGRKEGKRIREGRGNRERNAAKPWLGC
jgi:hypothetical protein